MTSFITIHFSSFKASALRVTIAVFLCMLSSNIVFYGTPIAQVEAATIPTFIANNITGDVGSSWGTTSADFNGDGKIDIYVANYNQQNKLWINNGSGSFTNKDITGDTGNSKGAIAADFNGDGKIDIYVANQNEQNKLWINNGSGSFTSQDIAGDVGNSAGVTAADFNGDGKIDIYVANQNEQNKLWINNGSGIFTAKNIPNDTGTSMGATAADFNGDGKIDIYVANTSLEQNNLWINNGSGIFTAKNIPNDKGNSRGATSADFNGDGKIDIYVANQGQQNKLWINSGTGVFTSQDIAGDVENSVGATAADFNGDGKIDIYVVNDGGQNKLWINSGTGMFTSRDITGDSGASLAVTAADFNGDGLNDIYIALAGSSPQNKLWMNIPATIDLSVSVNNLAENNGSVKITATLTGSLNDAAVVVAVGFGGNAVLGVDYTRSSSTITIPAGQRSGFITLTGINNAIINASRSITYTINSITNGPISGTVASGSISIIDDDSAKFAPGGVVSGLALWLDPSVGVNIINANVGEWTDRANGLFFSSANTYVTTATSPNLSNVAFNFNPGLYFDGVKDGLSTIKDAADFGFASFSVYSVQNSNVTDSDGDAVFHYSANGGNDLAFFIADDRLDVNVNGIATTITGFNALISGSVNDRKPHITSHLSDNTQGVVYVDGKLVKTNTGNTTLPGGGCMFIGLDQDISECRYGANEFRGDVGEIMLYDRKLTNTERKKIDSYLGIKYGITINQSVATDYIDSMGSVIWNANTNSGNKNNITIIGRDDASGLTQKVSKSINPDSLVVIAVSGSKIGDNMLNTGTFASDRSFVAIGDNSGQITSFTGTGAPAGTKILGRTWKIQKSAGVSGVRLEIPASTSASDTKAPYVPGQMMLLVSNTNSFATPISATDMKLVGTNWMTDVEIADGQFFTFASVSRVNLSVSTGNLYENSGSVKIIATLSGSSIATASTVTLLLSGTALSGVDYTGSSMITIPAGQTSGFTTITAINNNSVNPARVITYEILSTSGVVIGDTTVGSINIIDDEKATFIPKPAGLSIFHLNDGGYNFQQGYNNGLFNKNPTPVSNNTLLPVYGFADNKAQLYGDVNGDGYDDIVEADENGGGANAGRFFTLINNKAGGFLSYISTTGVTMSSYGFGNDINEGTHLGDINGDGFADIVFMYRQSAGDNGIKAYLGDGAGKFAKTPITSQSSNVRDAGMPIVGSNNNEVQLMGDFNGDGRQDMMFGLGSTSNILDIYLSLGTGSFGSRITTTGIDTYDFGYSSDEVTMVGDTNGDGCDDIIHANATNAKIRTTISNCNGTFKTTTKVTSLPVGYDFGATNSQNTFAGDMNNDGFADILFLNENNGGSAYYHYYEGNGDGTFKSLIVTSGPTYPTVNFGNGGGEGTYLGYFLDSSKISVDLIPMSGSISESGGVAIINAVLTGGTSKSEIYIEYALTGTALLGVDYTGTTLTGLIIIPIGATTGSSTINVTAINNSIVEDNKTINYKITKIGNALTGTMSTGTITIVDDEMLEVNLSADPSSIPESGGFTKIIGTLSGGISTTDIFIPLEFSGTANYGSDYFSPALGFYIFSGQTSGFLLITGVNNMVAEGNKTLILTIKNPTGAQIGSTGSVTVTIMDDETLSVNLTTQDASISESGGNTIITASLTGGTSTTGITIQVGLSGTALVAVDYTIDAATIFIPAGQITGTALITSINDILAEGSETIDFYIESIANASSGTISTGTIEIIDDEALSVNLSSSPATISENGGTGIILLSLIGGVSPTATTVTVGLGGTAAIAIDYIASNTTVTIPAGQTTGEIIITAANNNLIQGDKTIIYMLNEIVGSAITGTQTTGMITVIEDDMAQVIISASPSNIDEDGGVAILTATITGSTSPVDIVLNLIPSGTATFNVDYIVSAGSITILAGQTTGSLIVTAIDDLANEANERIEYTITSASGILTGNITGITGHISIIDNDPPFVHLSVSTGLILESDSTIVTITAYMSGGITPMGDVTVELASDGSATLGSDFSLSSSTLTITAGTTGSSTTFIVTDDNLAEGNEIIQLYIQSITGDASAGVLDNISATIIDDEFLSVNLTTNSGSINEDGGVAILTANLIGGISASDITFMVDFTGSAQFAIDYQASSTSITILAGQTSSSITLTGLNDMLSEGNESIDYSIVSVPVGINNGTTTSGTIIMIDDEILSVDLIVSPSSITENSGTGSIIATLLGGTSLNPIIITITLTGTAINTTDYTISNTIITIPAGQITGEVSYTAIDDNLAQGNRTIDYAIDTLSAGVNSGTSTTGTIIIIDDEIIQSNLIATPTSISEVGGVSIITFTLTGGIYNTAITFTLSPISTGNGVSYNVPTTFTIGSGQTTGSVTFTAIDDVIVGNNKTIVINVTSTGALSFTGSVNIDITDNDVVSTDTNNNGISDSDEVYICNLYPSTPDCPNVNPTADTDGDGISDAQEILNGSDPTSSTSPAYTGTGSATGDNNNNGVTNAQEQYICTLYPATSNCPNVDPIVDSDGDGISDVQEILNGSDPLSPSYSGTGSATGDNNNNGINNAQEQFICNLHPNTPTCPNVDITADSDGDGIPDAIEILNGSNPTDGASPAYSGTGSVTGDNNNNGLTNLQEQYICMLYPSISTCPNVDITTDTDGDGVPDRQEILIDNTDPLDPNSADADHDGIPDSLDTDDDGDGVNDTVENAGPNNGDANGDGIKDSKQSKVSTVLNAVIAQYTTLDTKNSAGACEIIRFAVVSESNLSTQDISFSYPLGLNNFEVKCISTGATVTVKVIYDKVYDTSTWTYKKYHSGTNIYSNISSLVIYNTELIGSNNVTTATYSVQDGGPNDDDAIANMIVIDPAGPAISTTTTPTTSSSRGGGGGSDIAPVRVDYCPNGDGSPSKTDGRCENILVNTDSSNTGDTMTATDMVLNCLDPEFNTAYTYARPLNITTMLTCQKAVLNDNLIRMHAAKMLVNFALAQGLKPDTTRICKFNDMAKQDAEMKGYTIMACQMGLMGLQSDGTPDTIFNPMQNLDKAQLATILSRMIYGTTYNTSLQDPLWYAKHVQAVKDVGIITVTSDLTNPLRRGWAILMLMRAEDLFGKDTE